MIKPSASPRTAVRNTLFTALKTARPPHLQLLFENQIIRLDPASDSGGMTPRSWLHLHLDWQQDDSAEFAFLSGPAALPLSGRLVACLAVRAGNGTDQLDRDADWLDTAVSYRCFGSVCLGRMQAGSAAGLPHLRGPGLYTVCFAAPLIPLGWPP